MIVSRDSPKLPAWHALDVNEVREIVVSNPHGLSQQEAAARLQKHGANTLQTVAPVSMLRRFVRQFNNVLIYVLLAAATMTAALQHWTDMSVILSVVVINALIGFVQENKAEKALAAIRALLSSNATVLRDGTSQLIPAEQLVPGDVVLLAAGDKVPADLRLITAHNLRTQEAILSGESFDIEKATHGCSESAALGERSAMAYSGTLVTAGQGQGIVIATGTQTEIGRISAMIGTVESPQTPLTLKLERFSQWLSGGILIVGLAVFGFGVYVRELPMSEMFMVVIGIAVSAIPEGLPAVISITMALGVHTMARRQAIVRHMPVIETLGSVTVICTDKTGTLTRNELAVTDIVTAEQSFCVTGIGYSTEGKILFDNQEIALAKHSTVSDLGCAAMLNNDAALSFRKEVWELSGDPTEGALMAFAHKAGQQPATLQQTWKRTDVIPFSAEARYMATLHHDARGKGLIYIKGAPERILAMCSHEQSADGTDAKLRPDYWQAQVDSLARQGKRVLAIAHRHTSPEHTRLQKQDVESGLSLLGLFGIMDTPREEASAAIATCVKAGIAVKMITGDHVLTAAAVGAMLGIPASERVMTGADIERLSDEALATSVKEVHIFARMHPEHKLRLVQILQSQGAIVAMTGDGVNDAPALKKADIGIAMGKQGTEVAKEAADLVLVDDNFVSIVRAIEVGRGIYRNIRQTIQFMLVTDGAEGLTLLTATLVGFALPITPLQILWVNMVTAVTLSLAFAFAPYDSALAGHAPTPSHAPLFSKRKVGSMLCHIVIIAGGTIALFLYETHHGSDLPTARTMAVNLLVFFQIYYLWGMFPLKAARASWMPVVVATIGVMLFQLAFTYLPWSQRIFGVAPLDMHSWLKVMGVGMLILLWLWIEGQYARQK